MSLVVDIKDHLSAKGVGVFATTVTTGWGIYISKEPATHDRAITLYSRPGLVPPNPRFLLDDTGVHIRIRGAPHDYLNTETKTVAVKNAMLGTPETTINGTKYVGMWLNADISLLEYDDKDRPVFVSNWRIISEPAASTASNRVALG